MLLNADLEVGFMSGMLCKDSEEFPNDHCTELFKLPVERTLDNDVKELEEPNEAASLTGTVPKSGSVDAMLEPLNVF